MKGILTAILFVLSSTLWGQKSIDQVLKTFNTHSVSYISVAELKQLTANKKPVIILDSREREEYEVSRIPGATYVGFSDFDLNHLALELKNKELTIVVYCSLGIRSEEIGEKLQELGYTNVKNLYGGIIEWKNKGYEVIDAQGVATQKVHTFNKHWGQWLENGEKIYD